MAAAACRSGPLEGAWLNAPGWRRAQLAAHSAIPDAATIALQGQEALYLFVVDHEGDDNVLRVQQLDRQLNEVWMHELEATVTRADQPRAIWHGQRLHLLWLDRDGLYAAAMDSTGQVQDAPRQISGDIVASSFDVAVGGQGRLVALTGGSAQRPGVHYLQVGEGNDLPVLLDSGGYRPQLRADGNGTLHAAWLRHAPGASDATIYYANNLDGSFETAEPLTTFAVSYSTSLEGPYLGLDSGSEGGHATVLWSLLERTGLSAGAATTYYISFPLGQPQAATARQPLYVPTTYDLAYAASTEGGRLQAGPRAPLESGGSRATPLELWTAEYEGTELVMAARASIDYQLRKQASQSALIYFDDGQPQAYQLLSFSRSNTVAPYVRSDERGYVYASWMEPAAVSGFVAYIASTAPDLHAVLNEVDAGDVGQMLTETIFGMLSGAALAPFVGILWLVAPLLVLAITSFLRRDDERTINPGSVVSLLLALAAYWTVKIATLPGFGEYVPFSSWIPLIPGWLEGPLRWGVLLLIAALALLVAWRYTYRRHIHSALNFMLIHTAVDSALSMAIYGSIIYGMI